MRSGGASGGSEVAWWQDRGHRSPEAPTGVGRSKCKENQPFASLGAPLEGWWSQPPKLPYSTPYLPWLRCDHRSHTGQGGQDMSPEAIL